MLLKPPPFGPGDLEILNKLYLELSLVCEGATSWRECQYETEIARLSSLVADWLLTQTFADDDGTDTYKRAYNNALHDAAKRMREGTWR